jgi:hypothetical protein
MRLWNARLGRGEPTARYPSEKILMILIRTRARTKFRRATFFHCPRFAPARAYQDHQARRINGSDAVSGLRMA